MATSHIIDIEDCETGAYTKIRKQLNKTLGGPDFWEYEKPKFFVDCSIADLDRLENKLGGMAGIQFLEGESDEAEAEEEVEETTPALVPPEPEEAPAPAPAPAPPAEPEAPAPPREEIDYSKFRC
jgi:hypothetical protein